MSQVMLVATIEVRVAATDAFHAFERQAAAIMESHGGRIERAVTIPPEPSANTFREVHIVTFPSDDAYIAYRGDPRLAALAPLRQSAVTSTEVLTGNAGPDYHAPRGSSA